MSTRGRGFGQKWTWGKKGGENDRILGATENGRLESGRPEKNTGWKMADVKRADQESEI